MNNVKDVSYLPSKRPSIRLNNHEVLEENEILKVTIEKLIDKISIIKSESQKKTNSIDELTKWVKSLTMLNAGNYPEVMNKINDV